MSEAASHAFGWAYQWWLAQDFHFLRNLAGKPQAFDIGWVVEIGRPYAVTRTLSGKVADAPQRFCELVRHSGQGDGMPLVERAARISHCVEHRDHGLVTKPLSFVSKASWFIWPENWTMFDSYASTAVLGRTVSGIDGFERFYAALDGRGWDDAVRRVRAAILPPFDPRMAERVLDAYLVFEGSNHNERGKRIDKVDSFGNALPEDLRAMLEAQSGAIAEILADDALLCRRTTADRRLIRDGLRRLRAFKGGLN
jgi:hypothetical protein